MFRAGDTDASSLRLLVAFAHFVLNFRVSEFEYLNSKANCLLATP